MKISRTITLAFTCLALGSHLLPGEGFSDATAPSLTTAKVANMECRYFIELLGVHSKAQIDQQLAPIAHSQVDTIVCCPMSWRFYNFPSAIDLTWKEPAKFHRNIASFPNWKKMVDNLQAGGDPLKDALEATRRLGKRFVISFRTNDNHYINEEAFPTHNNFWRAHPEYRLGSDNNRLSDLAPLFNYMIPEVRDFYFSVLEELCAKYDVDGVELDFQRAPRFFHDKDMAQGRPIMTAQIQRIRQMLDRIGDQRGRHLALCIRGMHTVDENLKIGADIMAWDAAGWLDGIVVSSSYIHTVDVGIEGFVAKRTKARIFGELNYVHLQLAGTGHNADERRYLTPEAYRAATLSYLERGADGVSFFNTYCIPQPELGKLTSGLLTKFKDIDVLRRSNKDYTSYATPSTMFGRIFPAKNEKQFQIFVADELPGTCEKVLLRFETKEASTNLQVDAWINGTKVNRYNTDETELFPAVAINQAAPQKNRLKFFVIPLSALHFGTNVILVKNADAAVSPCDFISAELALYMKK